jgi:hypothetical protein
VHERSASLALYVRQRGHRSVDLTHEIHVDHAPELFGLCLVEGGKETYRRKVYPGVESTVLLDGSLGNCLHLLELGDIGDHGRSLTVEFPYLVLQGAQSRLAPGRDHYLGAPLRETKGRLAAYSARGTHHHDNLVLNRFQFHIGPFLNQSTDTTIYVPALGACKQHTFPCQGASKAALKVV